MNVVSCYNRPLLYLQKKDRDIILEMPFGKTFPPLIIKKNEKINQYGAFASRII
jgi:hypothetical protein